MLNELPVGPSYMTELTKQLDASSHQLQKYFLNVESYFSQLGKYLRAQAVAINKIKWIYGLYGALDGLSTSFSMLKYFFDLYYSNSDTSSVDPFHDWALTPEGMDCVAFTSATLISLTSIANLSTDNKSDHPITKSIKTYMPFVRDALKALKNTGKGLRNAVVFADMYAPGNGFIHINTLPAGLFFGVLAAINRMWLRAIKEERKTLQKQNEKLLEEVESILNSLNNLPEDENQKTWSNCRNNARTEEERIDVIQQLDAIQRRIDLQHEKLAMSTFLGLSLDFRADIAAAFSGIVDAPYLYLGVLVVVTLTPGSWIFLVVEASSIIFTAICPFTRRHEVWNDKRQALLTDSIVELKSCVIRLTILFRQLEAISLQLALLAQPSDNANIASQQERLKELETKQKDVCNKLEKMLMRSEICQSKVNEYSVLSWWAVILGGLKNGIDAYGTLASMMFASATVALLLGWTLSPIVLLGFVVTGLASLVFFLAAAVIQQQSYLKQKPVPDASERETPLFEFLTRLKELSETAKPLDLNVIEIDKYKKNILEGMIVCASPQFFFQEWFEVVRLWCSGGNKGIKAIDSILASMQTLGDDGHYHDTPLMVVLAWFSAVIFALIFALRGFGRLGRDKPKANSRANNQSPATIDASPEVASIEKQEIKNEPCKKARILQPTLSRGVSEGGKSQISLYDKLGFYFTGPLSRASSSPELEYRFGVSSTL